MGYLRRLQGLRGPVSLLPGLAHLPNVLFPNVQVHTTG